MSEATEGASVKVLRMVDRIPAYVSEGNRFRGYDHKAFGEAGSFYDMQNMTGRAYPTIRSAAALVRI